MALIRLAALVLLFLVLSLGASTFAEELKLITYELQDQFDKTHTDADLHGQLVVLTGSDKDGSSFNAQWAQAISEALMGEAGTESIHYIGIADLRKAPSSLPFVKGKTKGKFPQEPKKWILMDWKGLLAKTYDFEPKSCNILVFDPQGSLVLKDHGREVDEEKLSEIVAKIRAALPVSGEA